MATLTPTAHPDERRHGSPAPSSPTRQPSPSGRAGLFIGVHLAAMALAGAAVLLRDHGLVPTLVVVAYVSLFPGDALRAALRVRAEDVYLRLLYAVAGSVVALMLVSLASSLFLRGLPNARPLDPGPLAGILGLVTLACLIAVAFSRRHAPAALPSSIQWLAWGALLLAAQGVWVGTAILDVEGRAFASVLALGVVGVVVVWGAVSRLAWVDSIRPALIFFLTLAVSWSFSLRGADLYGFDLHQERVWAQRTLEAGAWERVVADPYAAMLSVTSLPTSLVSLSGMDLVSYFKVWAPLTFALYAMGAFLFISRFASRTASYLITLLVIFAPQGLWQLPAVSRQEVALLLFAAIMLLMFGSPGRGGKALAGLFALVIAVTHYTTAYITLGIVVGALVLTWLWRLARPGWRRAPRHLPIAVVAALLIGTVGWNVFYTSSSVNVGSAVESTGGGLRDEGSLLDTFLHGANIAHVTPGEYFAETQSDAVDRTWLLPYSDGLQRQFVQEAQAIELPEQYGPLGALEPAVEPLYLLLRQGGNALMAIGVVLLAVRALRRRSPGPRDDPDLIALATVALGLTAVTRFNAELAQAYNPERLLLQTAFFLGVGAALLIDDLGRWVRRLSLVRRRPALARGGATLVLGVLSALLVLDATGLRTTAVMGDAGNLQPDGEYARRFYFSQEDRAAAQWLGDRYQSDDMVYATTYGALLPMSIPEYRQGVFGELSPYTLDQRAYVFATSENVQGGRARLVKRSVRTTFEFPREFLSTYKSRVYSNGHAEVYR